ncbi:hypothetical protein [Cyanobacterium sp. Dongsha4]|nr:hypothetical protein [Cyanobacterium sp. Dongsha4]
MNITQVALASHLNIPVQRINEIIRGKRGIIPKNENCYILSIAYR